MRYFLWTLTSTSEMHEWRDLRILRISSLCWRGKVDAKEDDVDEDEEEEEEEEGNEVWLISCWNPLLKLRTMSLFPA